MMNHDDIARRYADVLGELGEHPDPTVARLVRLLDAASASHAAEPVRPAAQIDAAVFRALQAEASSRGHPPLERWSTTQTTRLARRRLVPLVASAVVLLSGVLGYLRLSGPAPVSAQTVLRRAAARHLAPNQAAHMVETVTVTLDGHTATGKAQVWIQTDVGGAPTLSVQDLSLAKSGKSGAAGTAVPIPHSRFIQVGQQVLAYNPELRGDNTILLASRTQMRAYPSWAVPNEVFDGASVAQSLSTLAQDSPQQVRLLPQQTLDGHTVDVVEVDGWTQAPAQRTVFYFDAQSYVLRGFDATGLDPAYPMPTWHARLSAATTMAASAVPPQTFALAAPATATVRLDLGGPAGRAVAATFVATCHSTVATKELLRSGHSPLVACQATAPGVTAADLVAALAVPDQATLDAAVAAGVLTPTQAAVYLGQVQDQLTAWVTATPSLTAASATPKAARP